MSKGCRTTCLRCDAPPQDMEAVAWSALGENVNLGSPSLFSYVAVHSPMAKGGDWLTLSRRADWRIEISAPEGVPLRADWQGAGLSPNSRWNRAVRGENSSIREEIIQ